MGLALGLFIVLTNNASGEEIALSTGWNLKSALVEIDVSDVFGTDSTKFASVWKWTGNNWAVYLISNNSGATSNYAGAKGFEVLETISPGEGFWVNVTASTEQTLSVPGTQVNNATISLEPGWNLKGLLSKDFINLGSVFSDSKKFASVWKWTNNNWSVFLPQEESWGGYANSKGFGVAYTVNSGEGFWVNVTSTQGMDIEQPPPVSGKVIEMVGEDGFVPVSGVEMLKEGNKLEETGSQGLFSITALEGDTISFQKTGYVTYDYSVEEGNKVLIFLKKADVGASGLEKTSELPAKPSPKVITSNPKDAWIIITGMNLEKDTTVAISAYKGPFEVRSAVSLNVPAEWDDYMVIGGADIFLSDSFGEPTTNEDAGFSGNVRPSVSKIFGKLDFETLKGLLDDQKAEIYLFYQKQGQWQMAGKAVLKSKESFYYLTSKENVMDGLYPFVFVMTQLTDTQFTKGTLTGQVLDKEDKTPIKDAFIFMVGNQTYTTSDANGNYSLPYKLIASMNSTTIFAGVGGYYSAALKRKLVDLGKAAPIEMAPFAATSSVTGTLSAQGDGVISAGDLYLRFPTVLDKVEQKENGIRIGFDLNATYKWEVLDDNDKVLYSVDEKGKYFLANIDSGKILEAVPDDGVYEIKVTVTHKQDGVSDFVESTFGSVTVSGTNIKYSLFPNFTFPLILKAKSDTKGAYSFKSLPDEIIPFLRIQAQAEGFKPSGLTSLPLPQQGTVTMNIALEEKGDIEEFAQGFEGSVSGWETSGDSSIVKWQKVTNPEAIEVSSEFLGAGSYPDEVFKDVNGTLDNIKVLETVASATGTFKIAKGDVTFPDKSGQDKVISATLFDDNGDGNYDFVESNAQDQGYFVWTNSLTPDLNSGDTVKVSYPDPTGNVITLLPALEGDSYYWFGNINNGTYNDPDGDNSIMKASLTSPVIDLTQYSNVALELDSWFEVLYTGMPNPQLKIEVAIRDDGKEEGDLIEVQSKEGDFKFKQGYFTEIHEANPIIKNYYEILIPPPSIPETYTNYSSAGFGSIPQWKKLAFNLDPFAGHKIKIRFRVQYLNSPQNIYRGWAIDNIRFLDKKNPLEFAVLEPNSDFEPPDLSSVAALENEVEIGIPVNIAVTGSDNIWGIESATVYLKNNFGSGSGTLSLSYDSASESFKGSKVFMEGENGTYMIWKVNLTDYAGNSKDYLADDDYPSVYFTVNDPETDEIPLPVF